MEFKHKVNELLNLVLWKWGLEDLVTYLANLNEYSNLLYIIKFLPITSRNVKMILSFGLNGVQDELYGFFRIAMV